MILIVRSELGKQFAKTAMKLFKDNKDTYREFMKHVFINPDEEYSVVVTDGKCMVAQTIESIFTEGSYADKHDLEGAWDIVKIDNKTYQFQKVSAGQSVNLYRVIPEHPHFYDKEDFAHSASTLFRIIGLLTRKHGQILDWKICETLSDYIIGSQLIGTANPDQEYSSAVLFYSSWYKVLIMPQRVSED